MADKSPEDQMFKKGGNKAESFAREHRKGGSMHKKAKAMKMSEHRKDSKK